MEQLSEDPAKWIVVGELEKNTRIWSVTNQAIDFFSLWLKLSAAQNPEVGAMVQRELQEKASTSGLRSSKGNA